MHARSALTSLLASAIVVSLGAQAPAAAAQRSFEGVITFRADGGEPMTYYVRSGMVRVEVDMGGEKSAMIMDTRTRTMTVLIPQQRSYMQFSVPDDPPGTSSATDVKVTKLGKSEVVAGHPCQYVRITGSSGEIADVCAATDLGSFMVPSAGPQGGTTSRTDTWYRFLNRDLFPLKVISNESGKGKAVLEATKVERKALDPSLFTPPSGFRKLTMPMGPGGRD